MASRRKSKKRIAFIPDVQAIPNGYTKHIAAAGKYLAEHKPEAIVIIGDWWDMQSLNTYDKAGSKGWEDRNVLDDLEAGREAMDIFMKAVKKPRGYHPEVHFAVGNHEERITRAANSPDGRQYGGWLTLDQLQLEKWKIQMHDYLQIFTLDGIMFSHYFHNPDSKMTNAISGTIRNRLRKLGHSFCAGHEQDAMHDQIFTAIGERRCGVVAGRFYEDDHPAVEYLGPQKIKHSWSGIYILNEVYKGSFDPMPVSMEYLLDEYT